MILKLPSIEVFLVYKIISIDIDDLRTLIVLLFLLVLLSFWLSCKVLSYNLNRFIFDCCRNGIDLLLVLGVAFLRWNW